MTFTKITEQESKYNNLDSMSVNEIITNINNEDKLVSLAVEKSLPQIEALINRIIPKLKNGGRIIYIGAGTSGRLGILDASECPPTFGVSDNLVIGIIAGGDKAIRKAVENAEDSRTQGWKDLENLNISQNDTVIGIAASGTTPYVLHTLEQCNSNSILTGCITCNHNSPISLTAKYPIEVMVGPEFLTGSSRMKAGTAQKLVLNTISTTCMIQLGKVKGNKMVDMQLSNDKLVNRGVKMIMQELHIEQSEATQLLMKYKSVRESINHGRK
ncbi:N-acetylmuramic acid 6-phosphate etherase [uncultured Winogradskyella sp.]|uniref:N-acetylmuramic acid 6-phosphate etherase n=1 Tax=uncultured Winogradskyella sp. TaxID=395353 RepID=UPI00260DC38F|nr:N-acetylmuramic acid 6-phosphate etherase [uncultured Winogradskyella sp.]